MTRGRSFVVWDGNEASSTVFNIAEGLMQGAVCSPALFNIFFIHEVPRLFRLNSGNNTHSIAFADDYIIMVAGEQPGLVQGRLELLVNRTIEYYTQWNLRPNPKKFETILFRKPLNQITPTIRPDIKNFKIEVTHEDGFIAVEHKEVVK